MGKIVSLSDFKKEKGIVPANSIYATLNATDAQIANAAASAKRAMETSYYHSKRMPYAAVYGYKDDDGRVKLLKSICIYGTKESFDRQALRKTLDVLCVIATGR